MEARRPHERRGDGGAHTRTLGWGEASTNTLLFDAKTKENPAKGGVSGFSLGVLPRFHSVKKPSSQVNHASEKPLSKSLRIS